METERYGPLTRQFGASLSRFRKQRGLSLAQLAQQLEEIGCPLHLNTLNKIEHGRRGIDLDEVVALARVLRVPPLALVFPLGHQDVVDILPGQRVGTWAAAKWFSGEEPFPTADSDLDEDWMDSPTRAFRVHDDLLQQWSAARNAELSARTRAALGQDEGEKRLAEQTVALQERTWQDVERRLRFCRKRMRDAGLDPGGLPDDLAHIEPEAGDSRG